MLAFISTTSASPPTSPVPPLKQRVRSQSPQETIPAAASFSTRTLRSFPPRGPPPGLREAPCPGQPGNGDAVSPGEDALPASGAADSPGAHKAWHRAGINFWPKGAALYVIRSGPKQTDTCQGWHTQPLRTHRQPRRRPALTPGVEVRRLTPTPTPRVSPDCL